MFTDLLSPLKAIFRPTSELPNTTPSKSPFVLGRDPSSLDIKSHMQKFSYVLEFHRGNWDMLQEHIVTKVQYVKPKDSNSRHEYLVVTLVDHVGDIAHLMVQRFADGVSEFVKPKTRVQPALVRNSDTPGALQAAAPTTCSWSASRFLSLASASDCISSTNIDAICAPASPLESSQDLNQPPPAARDVLIRLVHNFRPPSTHTAILVFEPSSEPEMRITLLHLCVIIEAVHDFEPDYELVRSNCYWFAMTIFGILLLHGGRLKSYPLHPSRFRRDVEPIWRQIEPLTPASPDFFDLPIPVPPDELKMILKTFKGAEEYLNLPIVKPCVDDIWKLHLQSEEIYAKTKVELPNQKNALERMIEAKQRAQEAERKARIEIKESQEAERKARIEIKEANERAERFIKELETYRAANGVKVVNPAELEIRA